MSGYEREEIGIADERVILDPRGVAFLAEHRTLVVSDLHLEKGSAFARRGALLPPYDTMATLIRLSLILGDYRPACIVSLGDGFHDTAGARLITGEAADLLTTMAASVCWIWIRGNHDPVLPSTLPGDVADDLRVGGLHLRHLPSPEENGQIAGHLHPKARIAGRRRRVSRPCFVENGHRLLMPAFGSYAGGLNVLDTAISDLFGTGFVVHVMGEHRLHRPAVRQLLPEPPDWRRHRMGVG